MKKTKQICRRMTHLGIIIIGLWALVAPSLLLADEQPTSANSAIAIPAQNIEDKPLAKPNLINSNTPADGQTKKTFSSPTIFTNPWIALAGVLILILSGAWLLKRFYPGSNMLFGSLPILQVLGRTHLSSKQTLVMIKVDSKLLLLGMTDHQITPLLTLDSPEDVSRLLTQIEQTKTTNITSGFKHFFSRENDLIEQDRIISEHSSDKNAETGVLQLKNELNTLLLKVQKLKRNGGEDSSG